MTFAHGLQQAGDSTRARWTELERIGSGIGETPEHDIDLLQAT
jgi:hypothetical protein